MSTSTDYHIFNYLADHIGCECEITLIEGDPIYGRLLSFNKNPLTLQVAAESIHLINFAHVVQVRFAKKRNVQTKQV